MNGDMHPTGSTPGTPDPFEVITLAEALRRGVTRDDLVTLVRRGKARRDFRGVYRLGSPQESTSPTPSIAAASAHLGPEACAILGSAVHLHGIHGIVGDRPPEFALPSGLERQQRPGLALHVWKVHPDDVTVVDGIPTTTVARTLADVCRLLPRMQAVACLDSAVHQGLLGIDAVPQLGLFMARRPHCVSGRRRLLECRVGAQSPLETRVRLRASDGGLPPDELQVAIRDGGGRPLGFGDAGYHLPDGSWLVVEADGRAVHEAPRAVVHDRRRQNDFLNAGARIVRFTWSDTLVPGYIPSVLRPLLQSAGWRPASVPPVARLS